MTPASQKNVAYGGHWRSFRLAAFYFVLFASRVQWAGLELLNLRPGEL
jgi:hypothetical protein